jgi:hypothetical protein
MSSNLKKPKSMSIGNTDVQDYPSRRSCHSPLQLQPELCEEHQQQSQHFHLDKDNNTHLTVLQKISAGFNSFMVHSSVVNSRL